MGDRHATTVKILFVATLLGALGDMLFHYATFGINTTLWTVGLVACGIVLAKRNGFDCNKVVAWLVPPTLVFALGFALHDSPGMWLVNAIGLGVCLTLITSNLRGFDLTKLSIFEGTIGLVVTWSMYIVDFFAFLIEDLQWKMLGRTTNVDKLKPILRGFLIATPLVILFGVLMSSADAVFRNLVSKPFEFDPTELVAHGGLVLFFFGVSIAMLRRGLIAKPVDFSSVTGATENSSNGATESTIILGSLNALFALFVAVQFRYFFGGHGVVVDTTGLKYSEYARQGFFQLVAVSALALPVLLVTTKSAHRGAPGLRKSFNVLAGVMVALLTVVMASAVQRMALYVGESGLSELRLYTTAFMGWLAAVYAVYCFTNLAGRSQRFAFGSLVAGLAVGVGLNVLRPGEFIAQYNANVAAHGKTLDSNYLLSLGADAVPTLMKALPNLPKDQRAIAANWLQQWNSDQGDWRSFNVNRSRAHDLVSGQQQLLGKLMEGYNRDTYQPSY